MKTETASPVKVSCSVSVTVWQDRKFRMIVTLLDKRTNGKCDYSMRGKELYIDIGDGWEIVVRSYHNTAMFSAIYTDHDDNEWSWKDSNDEIQVPWGLDTPLSFEMVLVKEQKEE